jgi:hypothetical protein
MLPAMVLVACCPVAALKPVVELPRIPPLPTIQAAEWDRCPDVYPRAVERELLIRGAFADCTTTLEEMTDAD